MCLLQDYASASQAAGMAAVQTATHPPPADRAATAEAAAQQLLAEEEREAAKAAARAAAAEAAAQQLLAEEEKEAAKAAAKKSKKQKQKMKKQLRQQQQQASTAIPEDAGSLQLSNGVEAQVTAGDGIAAEAGGFSPATPDASSQAPSGSDRHIHHPHTLVSDSEAMCRVPNRSLHDLPTADSHEAAAGL